MRVTRFRNIIWRYYRAQGRHNLPWRKTRDVYRVLVSEIMLQQTQVERVMPFYMRFVERFPTAKKLSRASLSEVLRLWQGLGYNRRAKMLWAAAKELSSRKIRNTLELEALPGVGPYTARAVAAFACNEDVVCIETNIRTVVIHHFFPKKEKVSDKEIEKILKRALPKGKAREWYSALMDYGAHLKRSGIKINGKALYAVKQKPFTGSDREARGAIVRSLASGDASSVRLAGLLGAARRAQMRAALEALRKERLIEEKNGKYALATGNP